MWQEAALKSSTSSIGKLGGIADLRLLDQDAVEGDEEFVGTVGGGLGTAPLVGFGVAAQVLVADVGFEVFGGADNDDRQYPGVGVEGNGCGVVSHGSCVTPLRWEMGIADRGLGRER